MCSGWRATLSPPPDIRQDDRSSDGRMFACDSSPTERDIALRFGRSNRERGNRMDSSGGFTPPPPPPPPPPGGPGGPGMPGGGGGDVLPARSLGDILSAA